MKTVRMIAVAIGMAMTAAAGPIAYSISSNGNDHLYQIDLATGVAIDLGAMSFGDAEGLEYANGTLYGIGGSTNQLWNLTTSPGTLIGETGTRIRNRCRAGVQRGEWDDVPSERCSSG
jgi:hypothetical protein